MQTQERFDLTNETWRVKMEQARGAIDALDETIAELLEQRLKLSEQIGALKAENNLAIRDSNREAAVLTRVKSVTDDARVQESLSNIYTQVLNESCRLQADLIVTDKGSRDSQRANVTSYFPNILMFGIGLIGSTLARRIRQSMPDTIITGNDRPEIIERAINEKLVQKSDTDLVRSISEASLIILCASPDQNLRLLRQIAPHTKAGQVILDVTSTKEKICTLAAELSLKADFVGGHPLFGNEKSGIDGSANINIVGKRFCVVSSAAASPLSLRRVVRWLTELGVTVVQSTAAQHDESVADTSHLVQLMAVSLAESIASHRSDAQIDRTLALSGPALASLSRLMESPVDLWVEIIRQNRVPIVASLSRLTEKLTDLRAAIENGDMDKVRKSFQTARRISERINNRR